jgi:hypothetical protein
MGEWPGAMRRFLERRQCQPVCAVCGAMLFALFAALVIFFACLASEARAQEERVAKTGEVNHPIIIREHAGWNQNCDAIAHPALYLDEPPRHGRVCARIENIKIYSMYVGTESQCIGRMIRGVQLVYRPDAGYTGNDGLRYAAQYPSVLRAVSVLLTVLAFPPFGPSAAPSRMAPPTPQSGQPLGPVPACEELVF